MSRGVRRLLGLVRIRSVGCAVMTCLGGLAGLAGPAGALQVRWHSGGPIDSAPLTGLACPSASLCVAVDSAGRVLASVAPTVEASWHAADVDGANVFSGLSCPSTSLCVAVDRAGNVVTSTDPAGGAAGWTAAKVTGGQPLSGVSCASTRVCAAIGATVLVSSDPGAGPGAWRDTGVGRGSYYETLHYGYGPLGDAPPTGISCVAKPLFCVVVNDAGGAFMSQDPIGGASTWAANGPTSAEDFAVSCTDGGLCVTACPLGVTAGPGECPSASGGYEAGVVVTWNALSASSPATAATVAPDNLTRLWCVSRTLCFATDAAAPPGLFSSNRAEGNLYASTNPVGDGSAWSQIYTDPAGIAGVACPLIACVAVDGAGRLLVGRRPASAAEIRRALLRKIIPRQATIDHLLQAGGYAFSFDAFAPGRLSISWQTSSPRANSTTISRLAATFSRIGPHNVLIKLTRQGKRYLHAGKRLRVIATASYAPPGNPPITAQAVFTIRRSSSRFAAGRLPGRLGG